ncbi:MAG: large repetitive protein [Actinomycetota bacterium]|nr:large repetitive protein [Actinomycetota bacterium]
MIVHARGRIGLRRVLGVVVAFALAVSGTLIGTGTVQAAVGPDWTSRTAVSGRWMSVAHGCPTTSTCTFVAVSNADVGNVVMTSPDGITWTARTASSVGKWWSVAYGNGLFVAVGNGAVMTSPNGVTWTGQAAAVDQQWLSVTYGNGLFVAVANSGTNRIMSSPDGITWTARTAPVANFWNSVTYGNGLFVAVAYSGTGNRVMTSPDGITWTSRASAADRFWSSVTYGNGLFVAVAYSGTGDRVMTSPDGITWTSRASAADNSWRSVTFGGGLFVAVADYSSGVMTSPDGITWTLYTSANTVSQSVVYGTNMFVAVGTGTVMTSNPLVLTQDGGTMKIVPASGSSPSEYRIHYNTAARVAGGLAWGQWGYQWPTTLGAGNTIDINLATYQNAGSCTVLAMPATNCPRPSAIGTLDAGESMPFKVRVKAGGVWAETPVTTITRP